eukprot:513760_1
MSRTRENRMVFVINGMKSRYTHYMLIRNKFKLNAVMSVLSSQEKAQYDDYSNNSIATSSMRAFFVEKASVIDRAQSESSSYKAINRQGCFFKIKPQMRDALLANHSISSLNGQFALMFLGICLKPEILNSIINGQRHLIIRKDHRYVPSGSATLLKSKLRVATALKTTSFKNKNDKKRKLRKAIVPQCIRQSILNTIQYYNDHKTKLSANESDVLIKYFNSFKIRAHDLANPQCLTNKYFKDYDAADCYSVDELLSPLRCQSNQRQIPHQAIDPENTSSNNNNHNDLDLGPRIRRIMRQNPIDVPAPHDTSKGIWDVGTFNQYMQKDKQCTAVIAIHKSNFASSNVLHPIVQKKMNYPHDYPQTNPSHYTNILSNSVHYIRNTNLYPLQHDIFNSLMQTQQYTYSSKWTKWSKSSFKNLIKTLTCSSYYVVGFRLSRSTNEISFPLLAHYPYYLVIYKNAINKRTTDPNTGIQTNKVIGYKINKRIYCAGDALNTNDVFQLYRFGYDLSIEIIKCGLALGDWSYCYQYQPQFELMDTKTEMEYEYKNNDGIDVFVENRTMKRYDPFIDYDPKSKPVQSFTQYLNVDPSTDLKLFIGAKLYVGLWDETYLNHLKQGIRDLISVANRDGPIYGVVHSNKNRDKLMMAYEYIWEKTENIPKNVMKNVSKKVARGVRIIPNSHLQEIHQFAANDYHGNYSSINPHCESDRFSHLYSVSIGEESALSVNLKLNSSDGDYQLELPHGGILDLDSLVNTQYNSEIYTNTYNYSDRACNGQIEAQYLSYES